MLAHVTIRAGEKAASEGFYRTVLGVLGIAPDVEREDLLAWDDFAILAAGEDERPTRGLHVAFVAQSREDVDAFWRAGIDGGWRDAGRPGPRPQYRPDYYGAFLLDPDGNSAEAVHHGDTRRGGHVDHLWIGVRDLERAAAFYGGLSRHLGLRPGRRWPQGVQFRGAWATFSLIADRRSPTTGLHLAFPAPDRQTVRDFHEAATAAGRPSNGAPAERPQYGAGYYAAYVFDPDGTNVESVARG
jgi:catechol 2,3-dioxygenase-like lactoylglutathione lyase family enzyme